MVFFNYSTMQMAAKVVYYGPGLCGKTTNLQRIFENTATDSRGEMVSLATETDRTLFFDLLPIDVGSIAGFSTRIQLYTVPGQVFYNTTRKLVLKGVDGVVFVADSQRPMLQANVESFQNLEENLDEMGLSLYTIPMVLQYNKRDLPNICDVAELDQALNRQGWSSVEAAALDGRGVFETLKLVSKKTLLALKKRLTKGRSDSPSVSAAPKPPSAPATVLETAPAEAVTATAASEAAPPATEPTVSSPPAEIPAAVVAASEAPTAAVRSPGAALEQTSTAPDPPPKTTRKKRRAADFDALAELEKLRLEAIRPDKPSAVVNGKGELRRDFQLALGRDNFRRAQRFAVILRLEDEEQRVVEEAEPLHVEIEDGSSLERLLLRLNIDLGSAT